MKVVSLDVHAEASQLAVVDESGEVQFEMKVPTEPEALRAVVAGIRGPKRVVFEEGPLSAMVHDALKDLCEEVISCDPAHNALIAQSEDASDERDARRLAQWSQLKAVRPVYVPPEPYRTLRSVLAHDRRIQETLTEIQNRIQALGRRQGIRGRGKAIYRRRERGEVLSKMANPALRWQMESLYRQLDTLRIERIGGRRVLSRWTRKLPEIARLDGIPGVGPITARTLVGWIAGPERFKSRSALSSYAGLGLGQGRTNWKPVGRARASTRGNREIKRVLFLAAHAAAKSDSRLAKRYAARLQAGWKPDKALRDLARLILEIASLLWRKGLDYDDRRVSIPITPAR